MDEERVRELESWAHSGRQGLTASECVLLDAISEACREIRRLRKAERARSLELAGVESRILELQDLLREDRRVMEGAELELTLGEAGSASKARGLLSDRLAALESLEPEPSRAGLDEPDVPGLTD